MNFSFVVSENFSHRFGICCLFISKASGTISENCTYIQNPGFPTAYTTLSTVSWTVNKCSNGMKTVKTFPVLFQIDFNFLDICTLRFDFETFTTAAPTCTNDNCNCVDSFQITAVSIETHQS